MDIFDTLYMGTQASQAVTAGKPSALLAIRRIDLLGDDNRLEARIVEQPFMSAGRAH